MTSVTAGSRSCIGRDARGLRFARSSGNVRLRVTADTYTHVLLDDRELDYRGASRSRGLNELRGTETQPARVKTSGGR